MKRIVLTVLLIAATVSLHAQEDAFRTIVLFVRFPDLELRATPEQQDSLLAELKAYFDTQFYPRKEFVFDRGPVIDADRPYAYYGANTPDRKDALAGRLAYEVAKNADADVNFADYDNDADGTVDGIILIVPGASEFDTHEEKLFWPQTESLGRDRLNLVLDGKKMESYSIVPELDTLGALAGIGTLAHEFGHLLGLQDLYDTDLEGSGGIYRGLGRSTALMEFGNSNDGGRTPPNFNAIDRHILEMGEETPIMDYGEFILPPIDENGRYFMIPTDADGIFYLLENRIPRGYDTHIGGEGMLIYRIDRSDGDAGYSTYFQRTLSAMERWRQNQVNCNPDHPCAHMLWALPDSIPARYAFWPQDERNVFKAPPFALKDISRLPDGNISFKYIEPIHIDAVSVYQSSVVIKWTLSEDILPVDSCKVQWSTANSPMGESFGQMARDGSWSCTVSGLSPRATFDFEVHAWSSDGNEYLRGGNFTTRIYRSSIFRFIYLGQVPRNDDGSFPAGTRIPLIVYNSIGGEHTEWTFDGKAIEAESDGFWTLPGNGTLKACVHNPDGSTDIIIKEITVR